VQQSIDISCPPGLQQQTHSSGFAAVFPNDCCTAGAQQQRRANAGSDTLSVSVRTNTRLRRNVVLLQTSVSMALSVLLTALLAAVFVR